MTEIIKNVYFDEFYLTMIRVLKLIEMFQSRKKYKLTNKKIVLFDFYLRFPLITKDEMQNKDFDARYSFFHWKPNYALYDAILGLLSAKGLVDKEEQNDKICYFITDNGEKALEEMNCAYMEQLSSLEDYIVKTVANWSDKKIDEYIVEKTYLLRKDGGLSDV